MSSFIGFKVSLDNAWHGVLELLAFLPIINSSIFYFCHFFFSLNTFVAFMLEYIAYGFFFLDSLH